MSDMVNNPPHYTQGGIECIEAIESAVAGKSGFEGALVANVIKYLWRYEEKGGLQDVQKARWYLGRLLSYMEGRQHPSSAAQQADGWTPEEIKAAAFSRGGVFGTMAGEEWPNESRRHADQPQVETDKAKSTLYLSLGKLPDGMSWEKAPDWAMVLLQPMNADGPICFMWAESFRNGAIFLHPSGEHAQLDLSEGHHWRLVASRMTSEVEYQAGVSGWPPEDSPRQQRIEQGGELAEQVYAAVDGEKRPCEWCGAFPGYMHDDKCPGAGHE